MISTRKQNILAAGLLVLLIAISRLLRLHELRMNPDEIWSVWQTFGSFQQILNWTPYDWPPLYYVIVGGWWRVAGLHPVALRLLSILVFLIGVAFIYRVMRLLQNHRAGLLAALAYAGLGYGILLSIEVRGYAMLMGLMPAALWLTLIYFRDSRWWQGIALAMLLAAMFYVSYTSLIAIFMLGLFTWLIYGRAIWRWWLPGVLTLVLIAPEILSIRETAVQRIDATQTLTPGPLGEALYNLFWNWFGPLFWLWVLLLIVASAVIILRSRSRYTLVLGLWVFAMPVLMYVANPWLGFFSARYAWWVMVGIALWLGWGLALMGSWVQLGSGLVLAVALFYPLPMERYSIWGDTISPLGDNFTWMQPRVRWGDGFVLDPSNACGGAEEWDYYTRVFFPQGIEFTSRAEDYRRVLYVLQAGREDPALLESVQNGRLLREQVGPARCVFALYEAPPDLTGTAFENGLRFHGIDFVDVDGQPVTFPLVGHEGETLYFRTWWTVDTPLDGLYDARIQVMNANDRSIAASRFALTTAANIPVEQWQPGKYYLVEQSISLRSSMRSGEYTVMIAVSDEDETRLTAPGVTADGLLPVATLHVKAY
ncbi:MAG: glycosyltransferase family 39 protein [Anaerolineae bacterium]|nr:glycosyltransferase family 39 protein [Anaerolineae bacterium]